MDNVSEGSGTVPSIWEVQSVCSPLAKVKQPSSVFDVDTGSCADSFMALQKTRSGLENKERGRRNRCQEKENTDSTQIAPVP